MRRALALVVLAFLVASCSTRSKEGHSKRLNYVYWGDTTEIEMNEHWLTRFEETHPDVKVNRIHTAGTGTAPKILSMVAGGDIPDVMYVWPAAFPEFSEKKIYMPLGFFMRRDGINPDAWFPHLLEPYTLKGEIYGLPRSWHPYIIFYNKSLFDEAGVPYPDETWTWDTLIKWGKVLTKDRDGDGIIDQFAVANIPWEVFVWSMGGEIFAPDGSRSYFTMPETIEGLQLARDLIWRYHISPTPMQLQQVESSQDMFFTGRVAMYSLGIWSVPRFRKIKNFAWDIAVMPRGRKRATLLVTAGWAICRQTRYPEEAWQLVKYLAGEEAQTYQMKIWRDPSGLKDVFKKYMYYEPDKPPRNREAVLKSIEFGRFREVFPGREEVMKRLYEKLDEIFYFKDCDVTEVCAEMDRLFREIMSERRR